MNTNSNLQKAKDIKNDEFYTTYETIDKELSNYAKHFKNKIVLCNCDDPIKSNFVKYFIDKFEELEIKKIISTSYCENGKGLKLEVDSNNLNEVRNEFKFNKHVKKLKLDGNFLNDESVQYLKEADIVVTNPPFSLFREFFNLLIENKKKFLIIGNQNALTYKEIFPYIINNKIWTGFQFGEMAFRVPNNSEPRKTRFWIDESGQKWRSLGNAMWLTNLDNSKRHKKLSLEKIYNSVDYPKFDNHDAINVSTVKDIPKDYKGVMAVPITIIDKYNSKQFKILGEANHGSDNKYDLFKPTINGKDVFKRILIQNIDIEG